MPTHGHVAKFVAKPGKRDALIAALRPMFEEVKSEPGTLLYMMHTCATDPDAVWFYERYVDAAAFEVHRTSRAHDDALAAIGPLLEPSTEVHLLEMIDCKANVLLPAELTGVPKEAPPA
ncbi:MAG: putative quinol monooxygenase [Ramlibacter sp.]